MKKTYIAPAYAIHDADVEDFICSSTSYSDTPADDEGPGAPDINYEGDALGRRNIDTWEEW